MAYRFFCEDFLQHDQVTLKDDQAHHLIHVMRYQVGQQVTLFNGGNWEAEAEIQSMNKREVVLKIIDRAEVDRELPVDLVFAVALPKGDRQKFLIEKLVEVGAKRVIPVETERSVAQPSGKTVERLRKSVINACKQCERNQLMSIDSSLRFSDLCRDDQFSDYQKLIATTHGESKPINQVPTFGKVLVLIGPEGGFSLAENEMAAANGFQAIRLGPSILRVETAALVAATLLGIGKL